MLMGPTLPLTVSNLRGWNAPRLVVYSVRIGPSVKPGQRTNKPCFPQCTGRNPPQALGEWDRRMGWTRRSATARATEQRPRVGSSHMPTPTLPLVRCKAERLLSCSDREHISRIYGSSPKVTSATDLHVVVRVVIQPDMGCPEGLW